MNRFLVPLVVALTGCTVEKAGEKCDGFFSNGCKAPLSCIDIDDAKVCASSCDWIVPNAEAMQRGERPGNGCKDPAMEPAKVEYTQNGTAVGAAGCYCLPKGS